MFMRGILLPRQQNKLQSWWTLLQMGQSQLQRWQIQLKKKAVINLEAKNIQRGYTKMAQKFKFDMLIAWPDSH